MYLTRRRNLPGKRRIPISQSRRCRRLFRRRSRAFIPSKNILLAPRAAPLEITSVRIFKLDGDLSRSFECVTRRPERAGSAGNGKRDAFRASRASRPLFLFAPPRERHITLAIITLRYARSNACRLRVTRPFRSSVSTCLPAEASRRELGLVARSRGSIKAAHPVSSTRLLSRVSSHFNLYSRSVHYI